MDSTVQIRALEERIDARFTSELERYNQLWDAHIDHLQSEKALKKQVAELLEKQTLPKLMTPRQVADFVGISEGQFYAWKRAGDVPPAMYWSERTVRYDRDDVIAWAESHKVGGAG